MKKPGSEVYFPEQYMLWGSYASVPKRRQDKDSNRDMTGTLHRNVVSAMPSTITFATLDGLHLAGKQAIQNFFNACMVDTKEKKVYLEFWDEEDNIYRQEYMYLPDIEFPVMYHTANDVIYSSIDYELIGYGN